MDYTGITCVNCGDTNMAPIIYGFPTPELVKLAQQDIIALGGTVIREETHYCYSCNSVIEYTKQRPIPN